MSALHTSRLSGSQLKEHSPSIFPHFPTADQLSSSKGTGHIPGLAGRLNPIRDASDRTYLYADNIAINRGEPQPVSFVPGDEQMHLVDANGNKFVVRVAAITGRSSLIEYRRVRKDSCP